MMYDIGLSVCIMSFKVLYLFNTGTLSWPPLNSARLHNIEILDKAIHDSSALPYVASEKKIIVFIFKSVVLHVTDMQ